MKVVLEPSAAAHIRTKGGHVILFQAKVQGCCGIGSAMTPMLEVAHPRRPLAEYRSVEVDGVSVHIDKVLDQANEVYRIALTTVLAWRSLSLIHEGGLPS